MNLEEAKIIAYKLMNLKLVKRFDKLYKFTTENISGYISEFNFAGKSLLTVGSSGDQVINANMYGCNNVTVVDLNGLAEYFFNLKKAALLTFEYSDFISFFHFNRYGEIFNCDMYYKLRGALSIIDMKSLIFWDYLYNTYSSCEIRNYLFHILPNETKCIQNFNPYLNNSDNYNISKMMIRNLKVNFINEDIFKLDKTKLSRTDVILLSNIYDYNKSVFKINKFRKCVKEFSELLNDNGKMLVAYLYGTSYNDKLTKFETKNIIDDVYVCNMKGIRGIYLNNSITDTAIIYKKKQLTKR